MTQPVVVGHLEDSDSDAEMFRRVFAATGEVRRWRTSAELRAELTVEPDLLGTLAMVVIDLRLPDEDGLAIVPTLRASPGGSDLPIVVLAASAADRDIWRALQAGVTEYEVKPSSVSDLRLLVQRTARLIAP